MNEKEWHDWTLEVAEEVKKSFGTANGNYNRMNRVIEHMKMIWQEKENLRKNLMTLENAFNKVGGDYKKDWDEE